MSNPQVHEPDTLDEWRNRSLYHPPIPGQRQVYEENRRRFIALLEYAFHALPPSSERTRTLRTIGDALMYANQAVAVHGVTAESAE